MQWPIICVIVIFMEHSWQHILSSKPLETQIKTAQTNRMIFLGPDSCRTAAGLPSRPGRPDGLGGSSDFSMSKLVS